MPTRETEPEPAGEATPAAAGPRAPQTLPGAVLGLQRAAGNRAVARALRRRVLARYEAGEHAQLGKTGDELRALVDEHAFSYTVKRGETLSGIAAKFGLTVAQLEAANRTHLRRWRRRDGGVGTIVGFDEGDVVRIPPVLNPALEAALKRDELTFLVGRTSMSYGTGMAMGDFFEDYKQMTGASKDELDELTRLTKLEIDTGNTNEPSVWQQATHGRFLDLAQKNESHFAPPDAGLVELSGVSSTNHKETWEHYHAEALKASQAGNLDEALALNAFGDHFLTDAFAAGHLINKRDLMEKFKKTLPVNAKGEFTGDALKFFDAVAAKAFVGKVKDEFSKYETVTYEGYVFRPNINSVDRFSKLLQGIHKKKPDLVANAIARAVHTVLNKEPGGVPVTNARGDSWPLSGDETLNEKSRKIARRAVAQSQLNVLSVYNTSGPLDLQKMYARVWEYTPKPTAAGVAIIRKRVAEGTDPKQPSLVDAVAALITGNYAQILQGLVDLKILKKA